MGACSAQIPGSAAASAGGGTGTASGDATRINFPRSLRTLVPVSRTDEVALIEKEYRYGVFALAALAILVMIVVQVTMVVIGDRLEELHGVAEVPSWFARLATACGSLGFGVGTRTTAAAGSVVEGMDLVRFTKLALTQSVSVEDWARQHWHGVMLKTCVARPRWVWLLACCSCRSTRLSVHTSTCTQRGLAFIAGCCPEVGAVGCGHQHAGISTLGCGTCGQGVVGFMAP
mgnify:CR=1 FL=1